MLVELTSKMERSISHYTQLNYLGKGMFGEVYKMKENISDEFFAVKKIKNKLMQTEEIGKIIEKEIDILKLIPDHENIIKYYDNFSDNKFTYILFEYCNGGDLNEYIANYFKKNNAYPADKEIQHILKQITLGLLHLKNINLIHRDIKLDNILIKYLTKNDKENLNIFNSTLKIIDFGFAKFIDKDEAKSVLGSPMYMEPIILKAFTGYSKAKDLVYNEKSDIWGLGVLIYQMLLGELPFNGKTKDEICKKQMRGIFTIPKTKKLTFELISVIIDMLKYDLNKRIELVEILKSDFLNNNPENLEILDLNLFYFDDDELEINCRDNNFDINKFRNKYTYKKENLSVSVSSLSKYSVNRENESEFNISLNKTFDLTRDKILNYNNYQHEKFNLSKFPKFFLFL